MSVSKTEGPRPQVATTSTAKAEAPPKNEVAAKPQAKPETKNEGWLPQVDVGQVAQAAAQKLNDGFNTVKTTVGNGIDQAREQAGKLFDAAKGFLGMTKEEGLKLFEHSAHKLREVAGNFKQDTTGMETIRRGDLQIQVRPIDMNIAPDKLQAEMARAMTAKAADDATAYGAKVKEAGYSSLQDWSEKTGYYGSDVHRTWAEAASARTGGQIPADFWMKFDPFGGTAGTGPDVLPQGSWPGVISSIAMGHDTDWSLGRYFGAGPMAPLNGAPGKADDLGLIGLVPPMGEQAARFGGVPLYTDPRGMTDWVVKQVKD